MDFDDRLALFERRYWHEIEQREKLEARTRTPMLVLGIVAGILGYLLKSTVLQKSFEFHWSLFAFVCVACIAFIASLFFFVRALVGYHYQLLPTSDGLESYYQAILKRFQSVSAAQAKNWAKGDFEKYLMSCYVEFASQNTRNNDAKALNLHRCMIGLAVAFTSSSLAFIPFFWNLLSE